MKRLIGESASWQPGVVSVGDHFKDGPVHLVSNYWGLDSFMQRPDLPHDQLKMAHITTAAKPYPEFNEPARFLAAERSWLAAQQEAGRIQSFEYCISSKSTDEIHEGLSGADVIFMGGGNTLYLHEQLKDTGADQVIRDMVRDGVWYLGKSAGAIVAGPDINPRGFFLRSMATKEIEDTAALGLTPVYPLPHIDTPSIMNAEYDGKTGWQHAAEMMQLYPTAYILDNTDWNKQ